MWYFPPNGGGSFRIGEVLRRHQFFLAHLRGLDGLIDRRVKRISTAFFTFGLR